MNRCKKCGAEVADNAKFCNVCGFSLADTEGMPGDAAVQENVTPAGAAETQAFGAGVQNGAPVDGGQAFGAGVQNGAPVNGGQAFGAGAQMNGGQQFGNGPQFQQAAPKETAAAYYAKQPYTPPADDAQANKGVAICGYIGLLWIVPLLTTAKHSPFAKFHANQGLMVFLTSIAAGIVVKIINAILLAISMKWKMFVITGFLSLAASVFALVLMIVGIVFAAQGKMKEIPIIGQFHIIK